MKSAFVDSSAFFAHLVEEDSGHASATTIFRQASGEHWQLVTTNAVVYETHALLLARLRNGLRVSAAFLENLDTGFCRIEHVTEADDQRARALLRSRADKGYSFCDALSFVTADRLGIKTAIAFDRHFASWGRFSILG